MKNLFVDMDGTLAVWQSVQSMEELYQPDFFRKAEEYPAMVSAVKALNNDGYNVYILSACVNSPYAESEKREWLDRVGLFAPDSKNILFCPNGASKAEYIEQMFGRPLTKDDILLDDYSVNLHDWDKHGGMGIKVMNGVNGTGGTWQGPEVPVEYYDFHIKSMIETFCSEDGELFWIIHFAQTQCILWGWSKTDQDRLRNLWTVYCQHQGLKVDTPAYDNNLELVHGQIRRGIGFDEFRNFMSEFISSI